jgi:hypothetical protein
MDTQSNIQMAPISKTIRYTLIISPWK